MDESTKGLVLMMAKMTTTTTMMVMVMIESNAMDTERQQDEKPEVFDNYTNTLRI